MSELSRSTPQISAKELPAEVLINIFQFAISFGEVSYLSLRRTCRAFDYLLGLPVTQSALFEGLILPKLKKKHDVPEEGFVADGDSFIPHCHLRVPASIRNLGYLGLNYVELDDLIVSNPAVFNFLACGLLSREDYERAQDLKFHALPGDFYRTFVKVSEQFPTSATTKAFCFFSTGGVGDLRLQTKGYGSPGNIFTRKSRIFGPPHELDKVLDSEATAVEKEGQNLPAEVATEFMSFSMPPITSVLFENPEDFSLVFSPMRLALMDFGNLSDVRDYVKKFLKNHINIAYMLAGPELTSMESYLIAVKDFYGDEFLGKIAGFSPLEVEFIISGFHEDHAKVLASLIMRNIELQKALQEAIEIARSATVYTIADLGWQQRNFLESLIRELENQDSRNEQEFEVLIILRHKLQSLKVPSIRAGNESFHGFFVRFNLDLKADEAVKPLPSLEEESLSRTTSLATNESISSSAPAPTLLFSEGSSSSGSSPRDRSEHPGYGSTPVYQTLIC